MLALPFGQAPGGGTLADLRYAWGNDGYSASLEYAGEVAAQAVRTKGPILECGTGFTTILLGILAAHHGIEVWCLEQSSEWYRRINATLYRLQIPNIHVSHVRMREYGEFHWYDPPLQSMPGQFRLVICDGPPGSTLGGRFGLLPVMGAHLRPEAVVLLDDTQRSTEIETIRRWQATHPMSVEHKQVGSRSFAIITLM